LNFSIATRDELWIHGRLVERRLAHGQAFEDERGIHATDAHDAALVAMCDAAAEANDVSGVTRTIVVTLGDRSVVTAPEHFAHDVALLRDAPEGDAVPRPLPFVWKHGAGAVLLHEAIGHPREHGQPAIALPPWLRVDAPLQMRRASFKDVPLQRMTDVVAYQRDAPFALPEERIEIVLVDGGTYDPLTELVTLRIAAANLIEANRVRALAPFTIRETRSTMLRSIVGAAGETRRYPGVICSREGQELVVGSYAPDLLTELR
jgi:predicted Zn-dependent protease